jgi:hypothetical protein
LRDSIPTPAAPGRDTTVRDTTVRDTTTRDTTVADSAVADSARRPGGARPRRQLGPNPKERAQIQLLLGMAQPVRAFTIAQTDTTFTVTNDDGFTYTVYLDGRKSILPLSDSVSVETRAKWEDGALVIEYKPTGGGELREIYYLADSRQYLRVEVVAEYKAMFRRYWDSRMYRRSQTGT